MIDWEAAKRRAAEMDRKLGRGSGGGNPPPASPPGAKLGSLPRPTLSGSDMVPGENQPLVLPRAAMTKGGTGVRDWGSTLKALPLPTANGGLYGAGVSSTPSPSGQNPATSPKGGGSGTGERRAGSSRPTWAAMLQGGKVSHYGATAFDAQAETVERAAARMKEIEKQIEDTYGEAARNGEITGPSVMQLERERKGIEEKYPSLKRPGFLPWLGKNLEAGLQGAGSGLAATYDFLTGGKVGFISDANRDLRTASQETTRLADEMSEKKGGFYPVMGKLAQGTVGALPNAALALATGGASVPAQLGAQTAGLGATLSTAVTALAKNPGFWMANAQTLGNSYESAKAGGANEVEATATALLNSLLSSAVEVGGGIETLPAALARDTSEAGVKMWVRSMLEEGGEEVVQGVIENLTQKALYDSEKPVFSMKDEGAVINPGRMAGEFAMGAGVGGILGGGQMLAGKVMLPKADSGASRMLLHTEDGGQQKTASTGETEGTAINTNPAIHTPQEQAVIEAYQGGTDDSLREVFEEYIANPQKGFSRHNISSVSERQIEDAQRLLGKTYDGYKNAINSNGILHILKKHGPSGAADNSLGDTNDMGRIGYVLDHYDDVEVVAYESGDADLSAEFRTKDNEPAPMLKYSKKVNGTYYVIEAIPDSKYKKFWVVSAYMKSADDGTQAPHAQGPENTPKASLASSSSASDPTLPQGDGGVKIEDMQGGAEYAPRGLLTGREAVEWTGKDTTTEVRRREVQPPIYGHTLSQAENGVNIRGEQGKADSIYGAAGTDSALEGENAADGAVERAAQALDGWKEATFSAGDADVMTHMPKHLEPLKETAKNAGHDLYRKFVDSGEAVGRMGKELGDKSLYAYYNFARASSNAAGNMLTKGGAQTDVWGWEVGKSLADIFEPIRAKGDEYYRDFETYLFHRHNVDRMSRDNRTAIATTKDELDFFDEQNPDVARLTEGDLAEEAALGDYGAQERMKLLNAYNRAKKVLNKPVFGYGVSAMDSAADTGRMEREHPEFVALAEEVYQFNRNLMQYRVESGLLTQEQADHIEKTYPHYVPTYRTTEGETARAKRKGQQVSKTVWRATGGSADLMPLHVAMARQTMQVVRNGAVNRFGGRLMEDYQKNKAVGGKYVYDVSDAENMAHPDYFDMLDDPTPKKENTFTIYRDGKAVQMTVDKGLYEGIAALTPEKNGVMNANFWKPAEMATGVFKALVTGYNPMFSARNFTRDLQEAGLYSKDIGAWAANYPQAVKEIATGGKWWRRYQALGGVYSSVFDYQQGYQLSDKEHGAVRRQTLDRVEGLNMAIEQAPRLAEFMAQAKKHGDNPDSLMDAMMAAASVTTNFGRSGEVGKFLNRTFVPFLNPSIQGVDKMAKTFFGKKEGKEWLKLVARVAALGIAPALINELLNGDEPEWEDVRQSDKDVNWLISLGDGKYLKIPKGRDMSVAVMLAGRVGDMARGENVDWGDTLRTAANQIAPPNPLENNIVAAWADADLLDAESPGKTWYGGDIESKRLQGYAPGQRFDENTDIISKAVGGALGVSPKKLNYILDQYSGVVGDFVLPLLTPSGNKNPLAPFQKAFVLDSVSSNRLSSDFYDKSDELTYAKNNGDGGSGVVQRFWNKQAGAVSDVYGQIRETQSSGVLPNVEMLEKVRQDKAVINGIQKNALDILPTYEAAVRKHYTGDSDEEKDKAYREANREVFGAEYALQVYNKSVYERAEKCNQAGVDYDDYYNVYFSMQDKETTNEKRDVLIGADLSDEEKVVLYRDRISDKRDDDIASVLGTGLEFDDFLEAQNEYNTLYNQKGSASEKGTDFAHWLNGQGYTNSQYEAMRKAFQFYSQIPNDETIYERFVGAGVDNDTAYDLAGRLSALNPELGKNQVSTLQKSRVIVDSGMDDAKKVAALGEVMSEGENLKLSTAYQYSVPPDAYISYMERLRRVDANGSVTQEEACQAIDGMELSREQKAALWQLQNTSWKPYKNPYSQGVSGQVLAAYQSGKTEAKVEGPRGLLTGAQAAGETTGLPKLGTQRELPELRSGPKGLLTGRQAAGG